MNFKALLNPKFLTALVVLIASALGITATNYTSPEKDWTQLINEISAKRDNAHLEEYHGGR